MSGIGTGYDLSTTTYSPDGKVFQVDYACKAVDNGGLALGVKCKDGVVLGVEKLLAFKMLVPGSNRRIAAVDRHAGMAGTGLAPDARQIIARARSECSTYLSFYGDRIPAQILADRMAHYLHMFTLYWSVRPFGKGGRGGAPAHLQLQNTSREKPACLKNCPSEVSTLKPTLA